MATLLWPESVFTISHQEMIKGIRVGGTGRALSYLDTLVVPIIENTPNEEDLKDSMADVCLALVIVSTCMLRRHLVGYAKASRCCSNSGVSLLMLCCTY